MIGFLLWLGSRSENAELRKRLAKYESPPAPPPAPPPSDKPGFVLLSLVACGFMALLIAANTGGGVPVPVPRPKPDVQAEWTRCKSEHPRVKQAHRCMLAKGFQRSDYATPAK